MGGGGRREAVHHVERVGLLQLAQTAGVGPRVGGIEDTQGPGRGRTGLVQGVVMPAGGLTHQVRLPRQGVEVGAHRGVEVGMVGTAQRRG